jgi:glucosamine-6-phosphate deaminase
LTLVVKNDPVELGRAAGSIAAEEIRQAIRVRGYANIILATGASQFETLKQLTKEDVDWNQVIMFHLDEYIGLPKSSPASFRRYLKERFIEKVSGLKEVHFVNGEEDPLKECRRLNEVIKNISIDVTLAGIGENGHLGFNDPPADFDTKEPFIVVELEEKCRMQQLGEGWFKSIDEVPGKAITMSVNEIMKSRKIVCSVPDSRKAAAVKNCFENNVSNLFPASILQTHEDCICFLDKFSSSLLSRNILKI